MTAVLITATPPLFSNNAARNVLVCLLEVILDQVKDEANSSIILRRH